MNSAQYLEVERILTEGFDMARGIFLHGDCVGVDEECHRIAQRLGYYIEIHPPTNPKLRAFCDGDEMMPPKPYLERNRNIVNNSDTMLIVPEKAEQDAPRSGTWYTYRYALEVGKPTTLIIGGRFEYEPELDIVHVPSPEELARWQLQAPQQPGLPPDDLHRQGPG